MERGVSKESPKNTKEKRKRKKEKVKRVGTAQRKGKGC